MTDRMTPAEAVMLCRFAKAACPQQAFDEYTPDAWFELLSDLRLEDCKEAVKRVVRRQPFVAPAEIRDEVRRIRADRLNKFGVFHPPREIADLAEWQEWTSAMNRRIADGELTRDEWEADLRAKGLMGNRETPALEGVFRSPDDADPIRDVRAAHAEVKRELQAAAAEEKRRLDERRAERATRHPTSARPTDRPDPTSPEGER